MPGQLLPLPAAPGQLAVIGALGSRVLTDWYSGTPEYSVSLAEGLGELYPGVAAVGGHDVVALRSRTNGLLLAAGNDGYLYPGASRAGGLIV